MSPIGAFSSGPDPTDQWAVEWARTAGSRHPERDAAILGSQVDAMSLHQLAYPDPGFDPRAALSFLVTTLIRPAGTR